MKQSLYIEILSLFKKNETKLLWNVFNKSLIINTKQKYIELINEYISSSPNGED